MRRIRNLFSKKFIKAPNYSIPRTFLEGVSMNGMSLQRENYPTSTTNYIDNNFIDKDTPCGGIIALPTEINKDKVIQPSEDELKSFVYQKLKSLSGIIKEENKIKHFFKKPENPYGFGFRMGEFLKGKFHSSKENTTFKSGGSLCVEIVGVKKGRFITIAEEICVEFKLGCVMINFYNQSTNQMSRDYNIIKNKDMIQ